MDADGGTYRRFSSAVPWPTRISVRAPRRPEAKAETKSACLSDTRRIDTAWDLQWHIPTQQGCRSADHPGRRCVRAGKRQAVVCAPIVVKPLEPQLTVASVAPATNHIAATEVAEPGFVEKELFSLTRRRKGGAGLAQARSLKAPRAMRSARPCTRHPDRPAPSEAARRARFAPPAHRWRRSV